MGHSYVCSESAKKKINKISSRHKYLKKTTQKSTLPSERAWPGVQDWEGAGLNKNMHCSVGPGWFSGGACVHEKSVLVLKIFPQVIVHQGAQPFSSCFVLQTPPYSGN